MDNLINWQPFDMMNPRHQKIIRYLNDQNAWFGKEKFMKEFCKNNWIIKDFYEYENKQKLRKKSIKEHPEDAVLFKWYMKENKFDMIQKCIVIVKNKIESWEIVI